MSSLLRPTLVKMIYPICQKNEFAKSESSVEEDVYFIESIRAEAQNPMIKNFDQVDSPVEFQQDLEEFLNSLD
ncbi:unnamed protein product [Paramecium pentaurelia]|uniref:Uncharacterized protein n=1 Tax=Paramecium pentaurelia TaxID=43138 RepID=A0A8S1TYW5_9CILI|nr:unnamed protein product [Paramecium pentaurelia]